MEGKIVLGGSDVTRARSSNPDPRVLQPYLILP